MNNFEKRCIAMVTAAIMTMFIMVVYKSIEIIAENVSPMGILIIVSTFMFALAIYIYKNYL